MAKTFAKIAKTFVGLLAMIVAKGRRLVLIFHLEAKYAKMDCKSQPWKKSIVNSPKVKVKAERVNCLRSKSIWRWRQRWRELMTQLGLMWQDDVVVMSTGAWERVREREGVGRRMWRVAELIENVTSAWRRVERWMVIGSASLNRSFDDLHAYMICVLVRGQKR